MQKSRFFVLFLLFFSASFVFSEKPALTNLSHPDGKWGGLTEISAGVSYPGAQEYIYLIDKDPDTVPKLDSNKLVTIRARSGRLVLGNKTDGIYYLHIRAQTSSGLSETTTVKIMVDTTGPPYTANLVATPLPDGSIKVEWAPVADDGSGFAYYNVYRSNIRFITDETTKAMREFRITDSVSIVKKVKDKFTENSFVDDTVDKGKGNYYHYKVVAYDNAGNQGQVSPAASVRGVSLCDFTPAMDVTRKGDLLLVSVAASAEFRKGKIAVTDPAGKQTVLIQDVSKVTTIDTNFLLAGKPNGDYNVSFSSFDKSGDTCSKETVWTYDTVNPEIKINSPASSIVLADVVRFELSASDRGENPSGITAVGLFVKKDSGEVKVGDAVLQGAKYVFDWNTINFDNGRFTVIARATDKVGNAGEDTRVYNIENTFYARVGAISAISSAEADRNLAVDFIGQNKAKGIDVSVLEAKLARADSNLVYAKVLLSKSLHLDLSAQAALVAKSAYNDISSGIKVSQYGSGNSAYNDAQMDVFLKAAGLSPKLVAESKPMLKKYNPSREIDIEKINVGPREYYRASVVISVNMDRNAGKIKVVEVVPKKFADDANVLSSKSKFDVLRKDPVLVFYPDKNASGTVKFTYVLARELSKAQADALLSSKVWGYYVAPPIVVNDSADISSLAGSGLGLDSIELPQIKPENNTLIIGGIAVLVILFILFLIFVVVAVAVYLLFFRKKKGLK